MNTGKRFTPAVCDARTIRTHFLFKRQDVRIEFARVAYSHPISTAERVSADDEIQRGFSIFVLGGVQGGGDLLSSGLG